MKNKLYIYLLFTFCIVFSVSLALIYRVDSTHIKIVQNENFIPADNSVYRASVSSIIFENNILEIDGWAIRFGADYDDVDVRICLKNGDHMLSLRTKSYKRSDVTNYFDDGFNYDNAGLYAIGNTKYLKKGYTYEIVLLFQRQTGEIELLETGRVVEYI